MAVASLILGRYRLDQEIAAGGTARVWRAHDIQLDRMVAVKLLHPHLLPDETSRRRLAAEARAAAALSQPGIATVYDVTGPDEEPAIVMELVDGEPLSTLLARHGPMHPEAAARLAAEVADALYHAHQRGILHRDVKPGNILVEAGSGRARLIDFGIAHSLEAASESLTRTGTAIGTPRYMAPEQLAVEPIGPRTDLWGLGAVLYEALSGNPPFEGGSPLAIARAQAAGPPAVPGMDPALEAVVRGCLAVPIADRPIHAGSVAEALRAWLAGDSEPALHLAPAAALTAEMPVARAAARDPAPVAAAVAGPPRRLPRAGVQAGAAILLVVLAAAGAFVLSGGLPGGAATVSPTPSPTARPTPDWRAALLADYRAACEGDDLSRGDLSGMTEDEAIKLVEDLVKACESTAKDRGRPGGGGHGGNGRGHGQGGDGKKD